jgi:hypothetical protein
MKGEYISQRTLFNFKETYSLSGITSHKVIHWWGDLRTKRELVLNMEVAGKLLNNISLGTIKDIVGQEGVCS